MIERLLRRDINIKILSVLLAISLWLYVSSEQNPEATQIFPLVEVVPRNLPEGLAIVTMDPERVSVTVRGRPSLFDDLEPSEVTAVVDLSDAEAGIVARVIRVELPDGLQAIEITPSEAVLALESFAERELPVEISLEGNSNGQVSVASPLVFPSQVKLTGAETRVNEVARVVGAVDIEGITGNMVFEGVRVFAVDEAGRQVAGVTVVPETVRVVVPVNTSPPLEDEPGAPEPPGESPEE
ncbi:MAG TPA: CdaR family protein [Sphingobacteriaceae bacterium]|nr:CdaR family protein [Sphingobacteriaceae bacterium]